MDHNAFLANDAATGGAVWAAAGAEATLGHNDFAGNDAATAGTAVHSEGSLASSHDLFVDHAGSGEGRLRRSQRIGCAVVCPVLRQRRGARGRRARERPLSSPILSLLASTCPIAKGAS